MTLRTKLIAAFVLTIIAVSAVIGVVTQVFLSRYLLAQLDTRVESTQGRLGGPRGADPEDGPGRGRSNNTAATLTCSSPVTGPVQPDDSVLAVVSTDGSVLAIVRGRNNGCAVLDAQAAQALTVITANSVPVTVSLGDAGHFRVVAWTNPDGSTVVSGLSTADVEGTQLQLSIVMGIVAGAAVLVGGTLVWLVINRATKPLERVAATARMVSTLPLDRGEVDLGVRVPAKDTDPRTEVGQVGAALNQMLGHVSSALTSRHESENKVRRFVADASHELRTPLAAIRGYAELAGRNPDDTDAVRHSLGRVHSESERMSSLVDDLLLLARLDSGRPLDRADVDLTALCIDVVSDAQVAGPQHIWQLDLPPEPIVMPGDVQRLHQVLANLLTNARTHTPAGSTVTTALRLDQDSAVLTVTDNGAGIAPHLQADIFGRFVRGDQSRSRAAGSTGLGLAIVAAITAAHDGTVAVASQPGRTVFTVRLPLKIPTATGLDPRT